LSDVQLTGMPYVPGTARGVLQRGLADSAAGRLLLLEGAPAGPVDPAPAGFVLVGGAPFSHALVPLLGSGVPTVIITPDQARALQAGQELALDGASGLITNDVKRITPTTAPTVSAAGCTTADGEGVCLRVSARDTRAVRRAVENGAESIGLVRSEFLAPGDGRPPDAAFYRRAFREVCEAAAGRPVTIRLFDLAADKRPPWLPRSCAAGGVLGLQGVRLFREGLLQGIYRAQLEAIDALAGEFSLRVLLPYVADTAEVIEWCSDVRTRLSRPLPVGVMAETPAATLAIANWLDTADFVAIGCNDLMQCLFGTDRDRPELARYLDPHAPALYRFLQQVAAVAGAQRDAVQLCGVLPQLPGVLPVLLGLGFRVFSVEANQLPWLVQAAAGVRVRDARAVAKRLCDARDADTATHCFTV
jgi:phosphoenolpyruvate-protein kinase (PTS system EI component)